MHPIATLLSFTSRTLAYTASPAEALERIAHELAAIAGLNAVSLSLRNPHRGPIADFSLTVPTTAPTGISLSRELRSGPYSYGYIELSAARPAIRAVELFSLLNTLESLLLNYAILQSRQQEQSRLKALLTLLAEQLRATKLTPRAQSILARYGFSPEASLAWLEQQSQKTQVPVTIAAERFIAAQRRRERAA
jgi:hypothetical protein